MRKPAQVVDTAKQENHVAVPAATSIRPAKTPARSKAIPAPVLPSGFDTQHHLKIAAAGKTQPLTPADFAKRIASLRAKKVG